MFQEEKTQMLYTNLWLKMARFYLVVFKQRIMQEWMDIYLAWDPAAYGGVKEVRLPITRIWKPDILLYNSADTQFDSTWPTHAVVRKLVHILCKGLQAVELRDFQDSK